MLMPFSIRDVSPMERRQKVNDFKMSYVATKFHCFYSHLCACGGIILLLLFHFDSALNNATYLESGTAQYSNYSISVSSISCDAEIPKYRNVRPYLVLVTEIEI